MKPEAHTSKHLNALAQPFEEWRQSKHQDGLWRELGSINVDPCKDLSSNDYLGLSRNPEFCASLKDISAKTPMGSGGSRLLGGNQPEHLALEELFCQWKNAPAALCFASGFQANLSVFQTIAKVFDQPLVFSDAKNHASMIDGMRLSRLDTEIYAHLDMGDLEVKLAGARRRFPERTLVIASETVFSMTGSVVSLDISRLAKEYGAVLVADEAHSIGVLGPQGRGLFKHDSAAISGPEKILVHPCGKALAAGGAVVTASSEFIDALRHEGRGFVYSTGLSPWLAEGIRRSAEWVQQHDSDRQGFLENLKDIFGTRHPIFTYKLGSNELAMHCADFLRDRGWIVYPIRYPTVAKGEELIRLSLHPYVDLVSLKQDMDAWTTEAAGSPN